MAKDSRLMDKKSSMAEGAPGSGAAEGGSETGGNGLLCGLEPAEEYSLRHPSLPRSYPHLALGRKSAWPLPPQLHLSSPQGGGLVPHLCSPSDGGDLQLTRVPLRLTRTLTGGGTCAPLSLTRLPQVGGLCLSCGPLRLT